MHKQRQTLLNLILFLNSLSLVACSTGAVIGDIPPLSSQQVLNNAHEKTQLQVVDGATELERIDLKTNMFLSKENEANKHRAEFEIHTKPQKYLKIHYFQEATSPLLIRILNDSPLIISRIKLFSTLFDVDGKIIKQKEWEINEHLKAGAKTNLYLSPVTYHLPHGYKISSKIIAVTVPSF